jgi:hypothetical protein
MRTHPRSLLPLAALALASLLATGTRAADLKVALISMDSVFTNYHKTVVANGQLKARAEEIDGKRRPLADEVRALRGQIDAARRADRQVDQRRGAHLRAASAEDTIRSPRGRREAHRGRSRLQARDGRALDEVARRTSARSARSSSYVKEKASPCSSIPPAARSTTSRRSSADPAMDHRRHPGAHQPECTRGHPGPATTPKGK